MLKNALIVVLALFLFVCSIQIGIGAWDQPITSTIDITFTNGDSEVRKVTYTNIRLNEHGCIQISTEDDIHYKSIVCGVRKFEILK